MLDIEGDTEKRKQSLLLGFSVTSISLDDAIRQTQPEAVGQRNRCLFRFAQLLKSMPQYTEATPSKLKLIVRQWWVIALPNIGTKAFDETWGEFVTTWPNIRHPLGSGPMPNAIQNTSKAKLPPFAK